MGVPAAATPCVHSRSLARNYRVGWLPTCDSPHAAQARAAGLELNGSLQRSVLRAMPEQMAAEEGAARNFEALFSRGADTPSRTTHGVS